jgi:hypothetical protein
MKKELEALAPRDQLQELGVLLCFIAAMIAGFVLDGARIFAFGLVPAAAVFTYASMRGVSWQGTPRLFLLKYLLAVAFFVSALLWVVSHPR